MVYPFPLFSVYHVAQIKKRPRRWNGLRPFVSWTSRLRVGHYNYPKCLWI